MDLFLEKFWREQNQEMECVPTFDLRVRSSDDSRRPPQALVDRQRAGVQDAQRPPARAHQAHHEERRGRAHDLGATGLHGGIARKSRPAQAEAPVLFAKACELFILELTLRSWCYSEQSKRKTLQKEDVVAAIHKTENFDFLVDSVGRTT